MPEIEIATWRERIEKERHKGESEQIGRETEQLQRKASRLRQIDKQIEALFCSDGSCSSPVVISDEASTPS